MIRERDGANCVWCGRAIDVRLVRATTEHVVPRIKGGPSWLENEVAACARCNHARHHTSPAEWLDECTGRGWDLVFAAIAERGGQRRARAYTASQLRRLRKRR